LPWTCPDCNGDCNLMRLWWFAPVGMKRAPRAHHRLWWSVVSSPGDDNPAIAFVLGALLALLA